jgi:hypothetical protein
MLANYKESVKQNLKIILKECPKDPSLVLVMTDGYTKFFDNVKLALNEAGGIFNSKYSNFTLSVFNIEDFINEFKQYSNAINVSFEVYPKDLLTKVNQECDNLTELKLSRNHIKFDPQLLSFPPIVGKHPFENYQSEDIEKAINRNRMLFNQGTGTGKSYALSYLIKFYENKGPTKFLILTTKIGCLNLKDEILKFTKRTSEDILAVSISNELENRDVFNPKNNYNIIILSYAVYRTISDFYFDKNTKRKGRGTKYRRLPVPLQEWIGNSKALLALDESHNAANVTSKQSQVLVMSKPYFDYIYEFTGTFANKFEKMYNQLYLMDKALVKGMDYNCWCNYYNKMGTYYSPYAINPFGWKKDKLEKLNNVLYNDYAVKRNSKDVLNIKSITIPPYKVQMSEKHRLIYKKYVEEYFALLQKDIDNTNSTVTSLDSMSKKDLAKAIRSNIMAFQLVVDNPKAIVSNKRYPNLSDELKKMVEKFNYEKDYNKLEYFDDLLRERIEENDEKGIVWYDHPLTGEFLNKHITYNHYFIYSDMKEDMYSVINKFKEDKKAKILIASIRMANTSVTINEAKFNLFMERIYDPRVYTQCIGRINRIGQEQVTRNYSLIFDKSLDILQDKILTKGEIIMDKLLTKEFISMKEWSNIFNGVLGDLIEL